MWSLKEFEKEEQEFLLGLLRQTKLVSQNSVGEDRLTGSYNSIAAFRMARDYMAANAKKKERIHPYVVSAIANKIAYWHNWSVKKMTTYVYQGEFHKTLKGWAEEMGVTRAEVAKTEVYLKDLGVLFTENRTYPIYNSKFWVFDGERFDHLLNLYMVALLQNRRPSLRGDARQTWDRLWHGTEKQIQTAISESKGFAKIMSVLNKGLSLETDLSHTIIGGSASENRPKEGLSLETDIPEGGLSLETDHTRGSVAGNRPSVQKQTQNPEKTEEVYTKTYKEVAFLPENTPKGGSVARFLSLGGLSLEADPLSLEADRLSTESEGLLLNADMKEYIKQETRINLKEEKAFTNVNGAAPHGVPSLGVAEPHPADVPRQVSVLGSGANAPSPCDVHGQADSGAGAPSPPALLMGGALRAFAGKGSQREAGAREEVVPRPAPPFAPPNKETPISAQTEEDDMLSDRPERAVIDSKPAFGTQAPPRVQNTAKKRSKLVRTTPEERTLIEVVEYWNALPQIDTPDIRLVRHKIDDHEWVSRTAKSILQRLVLLNKGLFLQTYPDTKPWNDIPLDPAFTKDREYPVYVMKKVIDVYREYFDAGKGVTDKSQLATSLDHFLGSYRIRRAAGQDYGVESRSWFYEIIHRGENVPAAIDFAIYEKRVREEYPAVVTKIVSMLAESSSNRNGWALRIPRVAGKLLYTYETLLANNKLFYESGSKKAMWTELMATFAGFVNVFIGYLNEFGFTNLRPGHFDPTRKPFRAFIVYAHEQVGLDLNPTREGAELRSRMRMQVRGMPVTVRDEEGKPLWYSEHDMQRIASGEVNPWWNLKPLLPWGL